MRFASIFPTGSSSGTHAYEQGAGRNKAVACRDVASWLAIHISTAAPEAKAMDVIVLAIGVGFFALMFGYIRVCEKL